MFEKKQEDTEQENNKFSNETTNDEEKKTDFENQFLYPSIEPHYRNDVK